MIEQKNMCKTVFPGLATIIVPLMPEEHATTPKRAVEACSHSKNLQWFCTWTTPSSDEETATFHLWPCLSCTGLVSRLPGPYADAPIVKQHEADVREGLEGLGRGMNIQNRIHVFIVPCSAPKCFFWSRSQKWTSLEYGKIRVKWKQSVWKWRNRANGEISREYGESFVRRWRNFSM